MTHIYLHELKFVFLIAVAGAVGFAIVQYADRSGRNTITSSLLSMAGETWNPTFICHATNATVERLHLTCVRSLAFKSASNGVRE